MKNLRHILIFLTSIAVVFTFFLINSRPQIIKGQGCILLGGTGCSLDSDCCSGDCFITNYSNRCCVPETQFTCTCNEADVNDDSMVNIFDLTICGYNTSGVCSDYSCLTCAAAWFDSSCAGGGGGGGGNTCDIDTCLSYHSASDYAGCSTCAGGDSTVAYFASPTCGGTNCYCCEDLSATCGLTAIPESGQAPLDVNLFVAADNTYYWKLTYGDGQIYYNPLECHSTYLTCAGNPSGRMFAHTYSTPGVYTAKLEGWDSDPYTTLPDCVSQATISVLSGSVGSIRVYRSSLGVLKLNLIPASEAVSRGRGTVKVAMFNGDTDSAADLVPVTDPNASPVRIYTGIGGGNGIWAWKKIP